jgi:hypothetical protein
MVVVVDVPHADGSAAVVLAGELVGVEHLLGEDPLVALGFAVVAWGERLGLVVTGPFADDAGEVG